MFIFKLIAMVLIFAGGIAGGFLTLRMEQTDGSHRKMHAGNAFAGGIFLGAGLLHMLPDSIELFGSFTTIDFPFASLACGVGFMFVLFLEEVWDRGRGDECMLEHGRPFPLVLLIVLSIHSVITGVSLGLEKSFLSSIALFIAVIAHKSSASFALGIRLKLADVGAQRTRRFIIFFSCMTPIGILLGTGFAAAFSGGGEVIAEAVFDGIAAGTFIYIAVLDIIGDVFKDKKDPWLRFGLVVLGFSLMGLIAIWA